jgi:prevent-host-death family protein
MAVMARMAKKPGIEEHMKTLSAREAKYNFGRLIDSARAAPVVVEKHGRPVIVVLSIEEYERLKFVESEKAPA